MSGAYQQLQQLLTGDQPAIAGPPTPGVTPSPGAPGGPAPTPTGGILGGVTSALNNPLVEGALGSYLGYLGTPRTEPRWQRIGQGGLAGLQGFQTAEAQQLALPKAQAELAEIQARTKGEQATTAEKEAEAKYFQQNPQAAGFKYGGEYAKIQEYKQANTALAAAWGPQAIAAGLDPTKVKSIQAQAAASDAPLKSEDLTKMYYGGEEAKATIGLKTALTGQVGKAKPELGINPDTGEIFEAAPGVKVPKTSRKFGEAPPATNYKTYINPANPTEQKLVDTRVEAPPGGWESSEDYFRAHPVPRPAAPMSDKDIEAEATRRATAELGHAPTPGVITGLTGEDRKFAERYNQRREQIKQQLRNEYRTGAKSSTAGPTEESLKDLGPGWHLDTKINPLTGHPDAVGPPDATGKIPHKPWTGG